MGSLNLKSIQKDFASVTVLKDINLDVKNGEFIVFVGPSGCGKSTLLRVIAGLEDATAGRVRINGKDVSSIAPSKREIAMVFQTYALYPHLDVRGNMGLGLKQARYSKQEIETRTHKASEMLDLSDYLARRPAELSGGQRQRVAIGRAIVRHPQLFLFDEPLSNLDAALRVNTRLEIARLHRDLKATTIYVTHDQVEAMTLADRIVVLNQGRIEQIGTPMELYNHPANRFVAGFIGSRQMNFFGVDVLTKKFKNAQCLGIRPEHIVITPNSADLKGRITHLEQLGSETNVFVETEKAGLMMLHCPGQESYIIGSQVHLKLDHEQIHAFDQKGLTITSLDKGKKVKN